MKKCSEELDGFYVVGKHPYRQLSINPMSYEECRELIQSTWKKEMWDGFVIVHEDDLSKYVNWFEKLKWFFLKCLIEREYYK